MFFQAWGWLLIFDLALRVLPFRYVETLALVSQKRKPTNPTQIIERCLLAVDRAKRYHIYPMTCLRRSLALVRLLNQRGISAKLVIGVSKKGKDLSAHAWVDAQGQIIGEPEAVEKNFQKIWGQKG
jgi:hypothetical protein